MGFLFRGHDAGQPELNLRIKSCPGALIQTQSMVRRDVNSYRMMLDDRAKSVDGVRVRANISWDGGSQGGLVDANERLVVASAW